MSNAVTAAVYTVLDAHAGLAAIVSNRIYAIIMPQDPTVPAVTFQRVADTRVLTLSNAGGNGKVNDRIRVTCWAKTLVQAQATANQVRLAMQAATTFDSLQVFETDDLENDTLLYSTISDYSVWYKY